MTIFERSVRHDRDAEQHDDTGEEHPEEHDVGVAIEQVAGVLARRDQRATAAA